MNPHFSFAPPVREREGNPNLMGESEFVPKASNGERQRFFVACSFYR
jgi:hypothetical protein